MPQYIAILMSTYNGESFLDAQLASIFQQTEKDFHLYIRDDGSTDRTLEIIKKWQQYHENITVLSDEENLGAKNSFLKLLEQVDAAYYLFADQDDVWLPEKVSKSISALKSAEKNTEHHPILAVCDCKVVSRDLQVITDSFWRYTQTHPAHLRTLQHWLVFNASPGCSMAFNKSLKEKIFPVPATVLMHDWWAAILAKKYGEIIVIDEPLMLYRQHNANALGAIQYSGNYIWKKIKKLSYIAANQQAQLTLAKEVDAMSVFSYYRVKFLFHLRRLSGKKFFIS